MTSQQAGRLDCLQVLRAIAALAIALHHTLSDAAALTAAERGSALLTWLVERLAGGVDLFFVISGFVMVYATRGEFATLGAPSRFAAKRLIRIVPLYWLVTTAFLFVAYALPEQVHTASIGALTVVKSYLFIPALRFDGTVQPVYSLGWTLNYEMMFYALFSLAVMLPRGRAVAAVLAALGGIAIIGWAADPASVPLRFWTSPIILEFGLGVVIGEAYSRGFPVGRPLAGIAIALGFLIVALADAPHSGWQRLSTWGIGSALVVAGASLGKWRSLGSQLAPLVVIGDASYALYLTHPFAMRSCSAVWSQMGWDAAAGVAAYVAVAISTAIALALATHRLVEVPLTQALRRRLSGAKR